MAASRGRGPLGHGRNLGQIDPGTLNRSLTPWPGPIGMPSVRDLGQDDLDDVLGDLDDDLAGSGAAGLHTLVPFPMQLGGVKRKRRSAKAPPGITVNPASEISGEQWVAMINRSEDIPAYFQSQIRWKKRPGVITTPKRFRYPNNVIRKIWLTDFLSAFLGDWEISTHHLDVTADKNAPANEKIVETMTRHLSSGEKLHGPFQDTRKWGKPDQVKLTLGYTFTPASSGGIKVGIALKSKRGLITVCTRYRLKLGSDKPKEIKRKEHEILETLFHEVAGHAGRISQGLSHEHGDVPVETTSKDIEEMFQKDQTGKEVFDKIGNYLK